MNNQFILVLLFGGKRLPKLIRGVGQGIIEFKKASRDEDDRQGGR